MAELPRYDIAQSYDWNYAHAPDPPAGAEAAAAVPGDWRFCGLPVASPLGMPAGPLLNSRWILYYARLGFDSLTYKTARSAYRACYEPPNLLPVAASRLDGEGGEVRAVPDPAGYDTWAISFGMPSKDPAEWRADIDRAKHGLRPGQLMSVSVVASPEAGWSLTQVAADFAQCAEWAADAGADVVEANLSCPNVCTPESDLYLSPDAASEIAAAIRVRIGRTPLALKVGLFPDAERADAVIRAVAPYANALAATNSITAHVAGADGARLFGGLRRGIGGAAIAERCELETEMLARLILEAGVALELISVGGVTTAADVRARLAAGATHVHLATAPMIDPGVGLRIRRELAA